MPSWTSSESCVISDGDLLSEYYKELLYVMFQKQKQSKKHMDYEQVINVLAREKSMCEEELRATKSKRKLCDRLFFIMLETFSVVCVGFGMPVAANVSYKCLLANASCKYRCKLQMQDANASCKFKCKLQMQMQAANACLQIQAANANASCKCRCKLQMITCKCKLRMQMQASNENASCKCRCKLQMQMKAANADASCKCKLQMQAANAFL
ncbi:hypothetical protein Tco_0757984 [Tanacetum coccineum]